MSYQRWTTADLQKFDALYATTPNAELAVIFNRKPSNIQVVATVRGLKKTPEVRRAILVAAQAKRRGAPCAVS